MSWNAAAGAAGEDATLKTLTCLNGADPNDELVKEIKANLVNVATAAQLKGMLSSSTLPSQDVMNALSPFPPKAALDRIV